MDCRTVNEILDSDNGGADELAADVRLHLARCAACRKAWDAGRAAGATLRSLPVPPLPAGFADRVLTRAYAQAERMDSPRLGSRHWSLALAATFLLGLGLGLFFAWHAGGPADGYRTLADGTLVLAPGNKTVVRIALDADRAIGDVDFMIALPTGMELDGHPGEREVAWRGELKQGRNVLGLPLIAEAGASGEVTAELRHDAQDSVIKVRVVAAKGPGWWVRFRQWVA